MVCKQCALSLLLLATPIWAQMNALSEDDLRIHAGQGGVYLTGEFNINKDGGVLWDTPKSINPATWAVNERSCAAAGAASPASCGMRIAVRVQPKGDWYVVDNLKGGFSFEGLTLSTRLIDKGFFNPDGVEFNREVLQVGLPSEIKLTNGTMAFAVANQDSWRNNTTGAVGADVNFRQTNVLSATFSGTLQMQGNLLVFPK